MSGGTMIKTYIEMFKDIEKMKRKGKEKSAVECLKMMLHFDGSFVESTAQDYGSRYIKRTIKEILK